MDWGPEAWASSYLGCGTSVAVLQVCDVSELSDMSLRALSRGDACLW